MAADPKRRQTPLGAVVPPVGGGRGAKRSAARLAAVQALYQIDLTNADPNAVVAEFREHRLGHADPTDEARPATEADAELFAKIVVGASSRRAELDGMIAPALAEGWTLVRIDMVLRAMLRAGAFELLALANVPARVVINEYVNVAHMFFAGKEPGFVNGVLDRLARRLRERELQERDGGDRQGTAGDGDQGA